MIINISSSQYKLLRGTLTLLEMTPSLLDDIQSAVSNPLLPVADWAKMLLGQNLLAQQIEVRDDAAEVPQISGTAKFLLLLSELTVLRVRDNKSIFVSVLSPIVMQVTEKDLAAGSLSIDLPPQKLLRIKALDKDGKPAVNKLISYQNLREVPTAFYTVKTDINGEVLLCGIKAGAYVVASPECDACEVLVEESVDLDDQEIILQPRPGS